MSADEPADDGAVEDYVRPDWEQTRHAAQAARARDQIIGQLAYIETREGKVEVLNPDEPLCQRRYRPPGASLEPVCP